MSVFAVSSAVPHLRGHVRTALQPNKHAHRPRDPFSVGERVPPCPSLSLPWWPKPGFLPLLSFLFGSAVVVLILISSMVRGLRSDADERERERETDYPTAAAAHADLKKNRRTLGWSERGRPNRQTGKRGISTWALLFFSLSLFD